MKFIDFGFTRTFDDYIDAFLEDYDNLEGDDTDDDSTDYYEDGEINNKYFDKQTDSSPYFPKEYFMLDKKAISKKSTFLKYLRIEHDNYGSDIETPRVRVEQFLRESSMTSDTYQMAYFLKTMFNNTNEFETNEFDSYLEDSIVKRNSDIDELIEIYNKLLQTKTNKLQKGGKRKNRGIRKSKNTKKKTRKRHRKSKRRQRRK